MSAPMITGAGDVTRNGERQWSGLVRDGVNSASRYYLCHMRDTHRQQYIDFLLGHKPTTTEAHSTRDDPTHELTNEQHEQLAAKVAQARSAVIAQSPTDDMLMAVWMAVNVLSNDECVLVLTRSALYVLIGDTVRSGFLRIPTRTRTNRQIDSRVPLEQIARCVVGRAEDDSSNGDKHQQQVHLRITTVDGEWLQFRSNGMCALCARAHTSD